MALSLGVEGAGGRHGGPLTAWVLIKSVDKELCRSQWLTIRLFWARTIEISHLCGCHLLGAGRLRVGEGFNRTG